jgi:hypothetical protein
LRQQVSNASSMAQLRTFLSLSQPMPTRCIQPVHGLSAGNLRWRILGLIRAGAASAPQQKRRLFRDGRENQVAMPKHCAKHGISMVSFLQRRGCHLLALRIVECKRLS